MIGWLVGLLLLLAAMPAQAATINAASCTLANVQAAIGTAVSGDTVTVPSGSCSWSSPVTITGKALTLTGAGIGNTVVTCTSTCLNVTATATNFVTISGFTLTGSSTSDGVIFLGGTLFDVAYRIHHIRSIGTNGRNIVTQNAFGLVDHMTLESTGSNCQTLSFGGSQDGHANEQTPWTHPLALGTNQAVYVEDSTVSFVCGSDSVIDSYGGARWVFRHNVVSMTTSGEGPGGGHGTDSGDRWGGPISFEVYSNSYTNTGSNTLRGGTFRGGTGVIYNNTYSGGPFGGYTLMVYRACAALASGLHWNACTGTALRVTSGAPSNFWKNTTSTISGSNCATDGTGSNCAFCSGNKEHLCSADATCSGSGEGTCSINFDGGGALGYPCRNQPGIAPGQIVDPVYAWSNGSVQIGTYDGGVACATSAGAGDNLTPWLTSGRDYVNNGTTPKPGYAAFTYPHPLQSAASAPPTVTITSPTTLPTYNAPTSVLTTVGGTAADDVSVTLVTWACDVCGSGTANGTTAWSIPSITLQPGTNVLTVTSHDADGNVGTASLTISLAGSVVRYVDNSGSPACADSPSNGTEGAPFCTVTYGISRIAGGNTLYVKNGTYAGGFTITGPSGTSGAHTVISAYPGHAPILNNGSINSGRIKISHSCAYIDFIGFVITNHNQGLYLDDDAGTDVACTNILVDHITVHDVGQEGIAIRAGTPTGPRNFTVQNSTIYNTGLLAPAQNGEGIYVGSSSGVDNTNGVTLQNNIIHDTSAECIELKGDSHDIVVDGNDLSNCITSNSGFGNNGGAIEADEPRNTSTTPNHVIRNNVIHGLAFQSGITKRGIRLGTGATVYNNILYGIDAAYTAILSNSPNYPRLVYHNTVDGTTAQAIVDSGGTTLDSRNNIGPTTAGTNLAFSSAYFADASAHDYHLRAGTAPIDAGADLRATVPTDRDGVTRDALPDLGAYECGAACTSVPAAPSALTITQP